ncbi:hypothetical protein [Roseisalinus antarcticus]|uniref:Uncharacterized protein n=1 Tax=Roseisalinus antarcticus TaxID=254357 RepID=A0A1Y5TFP8_9RHOB|nr:hypothetical protein [Roseisalinus antarcticus]SLN59336.1 hypothetical protein ROA7023_02716 [Roseisalinus antarcticus]
MRGYNSGSNDLLFNQGDWHSTQDAWKKKMVSAIEAMDGDELLNTSTTDLARYYAEQCAFDTPTIHSDDLLVDQREIQIDVSHDRNRLIHDRSRPFYMTGTALDVEIPYSGNKIGFDIQPTTWSTGKPRGTVAANAIKFTISGTT